MLGRAGLTKTLEEWESGRASTKRPALEAVEAYLRPEDQLVMWKVDRLGRKGNSGLGPISRLTTSQ